MKQSSQTHSPRGPRFLIRALYCLLTATTLALLAPAAASAEESPSMSELIERLGAGTTAEERNAPLPVTTTTPVNMEVHWRLWQRVVSEGQPGINELQTLRHDAISLGIPSLPVHQAAILAALRNPEQYNLDDQATRELLEVAHSYAPHLPYAKFETARYRWNSDHYSSHRAVAPFLEGVEIGLAWLDTRIGWRLKFTILLLISLTIAFVGFLLAQLLRYFGIASYDGTRLLPRGFSSTQTVVVLMAAILVPGLILQSPVLAMLLLLLVVIPFQQLNERLVSAVFLALLALLPHFNEMVGQHVIYPGSDAQRLVHAHYHGCDTDCQTWLQPRAAEHETAAYVLATHRYWTADHAQMEALLEELEARSYRDSPLRSAWANLHGAVLLARGRADDAQAFFEESIAIDPYHPAPWFNRLRAYQILGDVDASHDMLAQASRLNLFETNRHLQTSRRDPASHLFLVQLTAGEIWHASPPDVEAAPSLVTPFWTALAGERVKMEWMPLFALLGALLILLTLPLYLGRRLSTPCPKCGLARDPGDVETTSHHRYCLPCYQTFVAGTSLDYHARVHSEITLGRRDRFQSGLRRFLSLILPGVGHSLGGYGIRGTFTTFLAALGILILFAPGAGTWRVAFELFQDHWLGEELFAWVFLSIAATMALTGLLRGIEPTIARSVSQKHRRSP